jgi:hypothetical protein
MYILLLVTTSCIFYSMAKCQSCSQGKCEQKYENRDKSRQMQDLTISGIIGAVTGPIGLGGASATASKASKVGTEGIKQGAVKFGCRAAVGAVSGATVHDGNVIPSSHSRHV